MRFIILLSLFASLAADPQPITELQQCLPHVHEDAFVVFNTNVVMQPAQSLGSDEWAAERREEVEDDQLLTEWNDVLRVSPMRLVEKSTLSAIRQMQRQGATLLAVTSRPLELAYSTVDQLDSLYLQLDRSWPTPYNQSFSDVKYIKGVLFSDDVDHAFSMNDKKNVVWIDRDGAVLRRAQRVAEKRGVDFTALEYRHNGLLYEREAAQEQAKMLGKVIHDKQIRQLTQHGVDLWSK
jgi:hypothetical protein